MTGRLNDRLPTLFTRLTGRQEVLGLTYEPSLKGEPSADAATLDRVREQEVQAGHALYGPHRDDFRLVLEQRRSESTFSQGEYRIALLALKLALNELLRDHMGFRPVIILDDLFSELDAGVQERLVDHLRAIDNQIFITTTQPPPVLQGPGVQIMEIRDGRIA